MKAIFDWTVRGLLLSLLFGLLIQATGCTAVGFAKLDENGDCISLGTVSLGSARGPCEVEGGEISVPGATLIGGVLQGIAGITGSLLGNSPIVITHESPAPSPD